MKTKILFILFLVCNSSCKSKSDQPQPERFDKVKWATMEGNTYPHRNNMLHDLVYVQQLKGLKYGEVITLLGRPNRIDNGHLFYTIEKKYLGNTAAILHTKTLVIKLGKDSTVE